MRLALCLAVLASVVSHAGDERMLNIDVDRSNVRFTLDATLHVVEGTFALERGYLVFDASDGTLRGSLVVDGNTGETGNAKRDKKMHGKVLETSFYPNIVFRPRGFRGALAPSGASRVQVEGTLKLHDDEHPLAVAADVEVELVGTLSAP
ncbi:MAG: YceI family protein [bacterium]|nr:YceI family protein [bacterium]